MVNSMTGFASHLGALGDTSWAWEIRSVNNKGFDLRQRLPDGCDTLELAAKPLIAQAVSRGTIYLSLKVNHPDRVPQLGVNLHALDINLNALKVIETSAVEHGITLRAPTSAEILSISGVMHNDAPDASTDWLAAAREQLPKLIADFAQARADEGASLRAIISAQMNAASDLLTQAKAAAADRTNTVNAKLRTAIAAILSDHAVLDQHRLEQEVAVIMVKADIAEELDRLSAHIDSARDLLAQTHPIGRKFDFLMQEFNREANTLCSKSNSTDLTRIGVDLKTIIDQMREQVQNVE